MESNSPASFGSSGQQATPATQPAEAPLPPVVGAPGHDVVATGDIQPPAADVGVEEIAAVPAVSAATPVADVASGLRLALTEDQHGVCAYFTPPRLPAEGDPPLAASPTLADLKSQLAALGCQQWWLDELACGKWLARLPLAKQAVSLVVAQRRDGRCAVKVAPDRMSARLSLTPPQGGEVVTLEQAQAELGRAGVTEGVLTDVLTRVIAEGKAADVEVAVGRAAVNGEHTRFELLVADLQDRHPRLNTHGLIDYRDLGDLVVVKEGTPLMRRVPFTAGEIGMDVTGNPLLAKPGTDWPFAPGLKGAGPDPDDPNTLVALVTGQPVPVSHGVKVDSNIVIQQVDMSTGNVKFDGAVNIKGDVKEGMRVFSTGDVVIGGTVEAGQIEAGGNVVIKGGVIGRNEYNGRASGREAWFNAKVTAGGSIHARYAENAFLEAGVDVVLDDYAMHSELSALNHVIVGKPGSRKGRCMGGHVRATLSIRVAESGSSSGMHTLLQAGYNPLVTEELDVIEQALAKHVGEIANLQKIIDFVQLHPERDHDGLLARAAITQELHQGQILDLQETQAGLQAALSMSEDAHVAVDVAVHGGTEVRLGSKVWRTADTLGGGVFRLNEEGALVLGR